MSQNPELAQLLAITGLSPEKAQQCLTQAGGDLNAAVNLFFEHPEKLNNPGPPPPAAHQPVNASANVNQIDTSFSNSSPPLPQPHQPSMPHHNLPSPTNASTTSTAASQQPPPPPQPNAQPDQHSSPSASE